MIVDPFASARASRVATLRLHFWTGVNVPLTLKLLALASILVLATTLRVPNLSVPDDNYDEGVYLESLLLMQRGYRPFVDIVATQGPLHLDLAYLTYGAAGHTLAAARLGSVLASLVGVLGLASAAYAIRGSIGALAAALCLSVSPAFLAISRESLPEAPAMGFAIVAVASAAWAYRTDRAAWRIIGGALLALACLTKPVVVPLAIPVFALCWSRRSPVATLMAPAVALSVCVLALTYLGPAEVLAQIVDWRLGGQQLAIGAIGHNAELLNDKMFRQEQPAFYALAAIGWLTVARRHPLVASALLVWFLTQLGLLLVYTELSAHLGSTLIPPLALLVGLGAATVPRAWASRRMFVAVACSLAVLWYGSALPRILERDLRLIHGQLSTDRDGIGDEIAAARLIADGTTEDEFVLTDAPYLAFMAGRMVPPHLVDPSNSRIRAGALTEEQVIAGIRDYDADVIAPWTGKLTQFPSIAPMIRNGYDSLGTFDTPNAGLPRGVYRERED